MRINEELQTMYLNKARNMYNDFIAIEKTDIEYAGPFLMYCWENEYSKANVKILFVGQETDGWNEHIRPINDENILETIQLYKRFELGKSYHKPMNQAMWKINKMVNGNDSLCFLWTNINKFGISGKGRAKDEVLDIEKKNFSVFRDEIKICNPDAVVFLCGYLYDQEIESRLGKCCFEKCSNYSERYLSRVINEYLPVKSYRTYHPSYLRRSDMEEVYEEIVKGII